MKRLLRILRLLTLPCEDVVRLVSQSLDRDLPLADRVAIKSHLLYCTACRRFRRQMAFLRETLRLCAEQAGLGVVAATFSLSPDARRRIKSSLRAGQ